MKKRQIAVDQALRVKPEKASAYQVKDRLGHIAKLPDVAQLISSKRFYEIAGVAKNDHRPHHLDAGDVNKGE